MARARRAAIPKASERLARALRRATVALRPAGATLVYDPGYAAPGGADLLDVDRGRRILGYLRHEGLISRHDVVQPEPATMLQLSRVHTPEYLASLPQPGTLDRILPGLMERGREREVLAWQRLMAGGTIRAAQEALKHPRPAVTLGGGMHHAHAGHGQGFCVFNDVVIAIETLRAGGFEGRVLIVDLDVHPGDGTRAFYAEDPKVFTCSVHASEWGDFEAIADRSVALGSGVGDRKYLMTLRALLPEVAEEARPDLVFYVAGTDVAEEDRLGSWEVSAEGIAARDRLVVELFADHPFIWTLAGGYGPEAWRHSARSLAWLLRGKDRPIRSGLERELEVYRRVAASLTPSQLAGGDDDPLDFSDILADLGPQGSSDRFLDYYTEFGLEAALAAYGVLEHLRGRGYSSFEVEIDTDHATGHMARLRADGELVIEIVLRPVLQFVPWRLLWIEWLLLQDPRARTDRPLLPGQQSPGLGCLDKVVGMLAMSVERLGFDGLAFNPAHYHVACVARGQASFLEPEDQARFAALREATEQLSMTRASAAAEGGGVVDSSTGEVVEWVAGTMVAGTRGELRDAMHSPEREAAIEAARGGRDYDLAES